MPQHVHDGDDNNYAEANCTRPDIVFVNPRHIRILTLNFTQIADQLIWPRSSELLCMRLTKEIGAADSAWVRNARDRAAPEEVDNP